MCPLSRAFSRGASSMFVSFSTESEGRGSGHVRRNTAAQGSGNPASSRRKDYKMD